VTIFVSYGYLPAVFCYLAGDGIRRSAGVLAPHPALDPPPGSPASHEEGVRGWCGLLIIPAVLNHPPSVLNHPPAPSLDKEGERVNDAVGGRFCIDGKIHS
jgi:hypothetical protein